jgi:hypothetical protein
MTRGYGVSGTFGGVIPTPVMDRIHTNLWSEAPESEILDGRPVLQEGSQLRASGEICASPKALEAVAINAMLRQRQLIGEGACPTAVARI